MLLRRAGRRLSSRVTLHLVQYSPVYPVAQVHKPVVASQEPWGVEQPRGQVRVLHVEPLHGGLHRH